MELPSTPLEKKLHRVVALVLQMSLAVLLFCIFCALSADGKPVEDDAAPTCGYAACPDLDDENTLYVHLVPHSHDDVGWLKTPDQYYFEDVQNIISSVVDALNQNPERRYVQVEIAFFKKWWVRQKDRVKATVQKLVNNGQFEFINAAWSMNDEADVHYQSTIDQYTLGLRYIQDNLGVCTRPKVGWQIDPFGHSREHASLNAQLGFDSIFFARLDWRDKNRRLSDKAMDLLWRGSANLGNSTDIFTSALYNHYSAPGGFCWDIVCGDEIIVAAEDDPDYNLETKVQQFADYIRGQAGYFATNHLLVAMGDDFRYEAAITTYINMDLLIKGFDQFEQYDNNRRIKVLYSTPTCYTKAVNNYVTSNNYNLEIKTDDFFPYADGPTTYWTGYFTSRPASKHFERQSSNLLQVAKQLAANAQESYDNPQISSLKEALGIMQHHDAITGTEKQAVADNYYLLLYKGIINTSNAAGQILSNLISGTDEDFEFDSCIFANVSSCAQTNAESFTAVVYNPLGRTTTTSVSLPIYDRRNWQIQDPDGNIVPYQIENSIIGFNYVEGVTTSSTNLVFSATDLPPLGYKVYRFQSSFTATPQVFSAPPQGVRIGYDDTNFEISEQTGLVQAVTMNGVRVGITQDFLYYSSQTSSGAYIFVPQIGDPTRIASGPITTTLVAGNVSQGVLQQFGTWASQFVKVYNDDRSFIEFDWIIGPININDGIGKEVISRYTTTLATDGVFYTDAYGREVLKRTRNFRPDYQYTNEEPVAGNYYPVNTKIAIKDEDQDVEVAVITDRSEGGSSINDGQIELMVHRACRYDDGRGVGENLNEQEYGQGIRVRGKHYLVVGPKAGNGEKSIAAIERDVAQRKTLPPWTFVTSKNVSSSLNTLQFSSLTRDLPDNVHLLTLEPWDDGTLLLRLEHFLENGDDDNLSTPVTVDVSDLFTLFTITDLQETTLGANVPLEENERLHWPGSTNPIGTGPSTSDVSDLTVTLNPMQIRTFLAKVTYT